MVCQAFITHGITCSIKPHKDAKYCSVHRLLELKEKCHSNSHNIECSVFPRKGAKYCFRHKYLSSISSCPSEVAESAISSLCPTEVADSAEALEIIKLKRELDNYKNVSSMFATKLIEVDQKKELIIIEKVELEEKLEIAIENISQMKRDLEDYDKIRKFEALKAKINLVINSKSIKYNLHMMRDKHLEGRYHWSFQAIREIFGDKEPIVEYHRLREERNKLAHKN